MNSYSNVRQAGTNSAQLNALETEHQQLHYLTKQDKKYLELLAQSFPSSQSAFTEIINLEAILNLPKGTEHFMSDVHGEYEAFVHILNNCSGVIRERVDAMFSDELNAHERADLCTLIYYPHEKLERLHLSGRTTESWYIEYLMYLVRLARLLSGLYTRSKVRKAMPVAYAYIIDELLHASGRGEKSRHDYHVQILYSIVGTGSADDFICSLAALIKRLAVDRLHLVGDIFDRGAHADRILDHLMSYHSLDIQWGNHDICWMGAAAGSSVCVATVVRSNVRYNTLEVLESAYGISLRELALFAEKTYTATDSMSAMEKAIDIILFKLEGRLIKRHPEFDMSDRLLLDKLDLEHQSVCIDGSNYRLKTADFPTVNLDDPYSLSPEEQTIIDGLTHAFRASVRLHKHIAFLFEKGSMYLVWNNNVLFHGCLPLDNDGSFSVIQSEQGLVSGKAYLDFCDHIARRAWLSHDQSALDWMYYLWCGRHSPLSGRTMKTFERSFLSDKTTWIEPEDPYYRLTHSPAVCEDILEEFGVDPQCGHIVNGHVPVKAKAGESPLRADGRLMVIDGGFCQAYHKKTGIAGYTLIATSEGMRIKAHRPFLSVEAALDDNADIESNTTIIETEKNPLKIQDTDTGREINEQIFDLRALLSAYRSGSMLEHDK